MSRYILRRIFQILISLFILTIIIFLLARVAGNPADLLLPAGATVEQREQLIEKLGLNQPYHVQYWQFITSVLRGDFGESIRYGKPTVELYGDRFVNTLKLVAPVIPLSLLVGIVLGVIAGTRRGTIYDTGVRLLTVAGITAPAFFVALVLVYIFGVRLEILPVSRMGGIDHYVLPVISMIIYMSPGIARLLRSSMVEVMDNEYVRLARSKGISEQLVVWKHCLRNAILPVLSFSGMIIGSALTVAIVTEIIFSWPGVGRLLYEAILYRDYPLLQGSIIFTAIIVLGINLIVDILYAYVDPRIRYSKI